MTRMVFDVATLGYIQNTQSIILDYDIEIRGLKKKDLIFEAGALGNFSLAGFEMASDSLSFVDRETLEYSNFLGETPHNKHFMNLFYRICLAM